MNIIQQPDALSLSLNLKEFLITSDVQVSFVLRQGEVEILSQRYDPSANGSISINIRDIIHERLSYTLKDTGTVYQQFSLVDNFTAVIDTTEVTFRVIRSGVDRLADSASNFLTQNFLTWQPSIKPVTYYSPEFLTYYAAVSGTAKLHAYFTDDSGAINSQIDYTIADLLPGIAYTIPLQYSVVSGWLNHQLPAYYDVWVEDQSGQRLTYIQRYYAEDMRSEQEQWVLFENSLGGIDTFRAYGSTTFNSEHTHNLAEIDEVSTEYRVDTERKFQKNTGYLDNAERKWLLDFFPSRNKYIYVGNYLRSIVVTESNVSYTDKVLPSNYTFTFKYADARPLLNLPRTDIPADVLSITVPEVGSFTVPPRLAEFPHLPLSEGALFPVQNPYSEKWATTTIDAIGNFLAEFLVRVYGAGGGVGHQHRNYSLLELLSFIEGYLLVNGQKIKAGYADKAGSVDGMDDIFLHKNQDDGTPHTLTIGKDLKFGDFISMLQGGYIDKFGDAELRRLVLRESLSVPEIRFNRMTYFEGYNVISPGGGFLIKEVVDNGDGTYTITPDREDGEPIGQFVDDILTGYWHNFSDGVDDIKGFGKVQFRISSVDYEAKTAVLTPKPDTNAVPEPQMRLAQTGNFTNEERQTYIVIDTRDGNSCITFYDHANTWDSEPAQEKSWFGKKKGRSVHGIPADNYSAVLQNIIMSGKIFQVDDITGEAFRVPLNKGAWKSGVKNAYYDEVSHNGSSWICVNPEGTKSAPSDTNPDWLKYVSKGHDGLNGTDGTDGKDGTSIANCGDWHTGLHVPYMGLTKMANRVFLCKNSAGTDNPPMWTVTTKDGNRILQTQDGGKTYGYIITGELNTAEYELLVENGKDGRDGKDYEWIFKHTIENVAPSTPGTSQVDDYIPEGWHDDAIGVSESLPYEWACSRTKKYGAWSAFTPAALWAKFGFDGESVIVAAINNEMESVALTYEGKTTASTVLNATVGMWYGTEKLQLKSISCTTPAHVTESYNLNTGVIAFTVASGVSMPERCQVKITVTAAVNGTDISRELIFTIAGVRAGSPGTDAVLYRLVPSVSSVRKKKDGTYSVASVSCIRTKSVGGTTAITTDGVLKYSKDGGAEVEIQNGTEISPRNFTTQLQFVYYVNGQVVDRETIPMVVDGNDGGKGDDGESVKAGGEWRTVGTPYARLTVCTMGGSSWLSKVATSNPPMWTVTDSQGRRITQTQDGGRTYGYILTGEVNTAEWERLTSDGGMVYLVSTVSNIRVSNAGSLVPSAFKVYAKRTLGSSTLSYSDGYIAARGYSNGIWTSIAGPSRSSEMTVNASAGYSTFSVRCYQTQADASAWNDSFIAEQSVGVSYDGGTGKTGSEPRPRGLFANGNTYVWNEQFHDIVLATFNNRTIPFRVRAYGTSVTVAPTSIDGDANWEPAQQFQFVATDLLLSRQIRADEIYVDDLVVQSVLARNRAGEVTCNIQGETGEVYLKGHVDATEGIFKNIRSPNDAFKIDETGDIEITGKIATSMNGTRIILDPKTNSLKMYNQNNLEVGSIYFITEEWNGTTNYYPRLLLRNYSGNTLNSEVTIGSGSILASSKMYGAEYSCLLNPTDGLSFFENNVLKKKYSKS